MYLLGYDIGSSSVKASLVDAETGKCVSSTFFPKSEAAIMAVHPGWAEQDPEEWWLHLKQATHYILGESHVDAQDIRAIGISYQMHGLVCVDRNQQVLRPSIIWCDSRAVPYGQKAFESLGQEQCLSHLLNSPGNFTASKLAWVKENEPEIYDKVYKVMLPGDYIAMRLSGEICTTVPGLSEGMFTGLPRRRCGRLFDGLLRHRCLFAGRCEAHICRTGTCKCHGSKGTGVERGHAHHLSCRGPAQQCFVAECL